MRFCGAPDAVTGDAAQEAAESKYFRHVHAAAKMIEILSFSRGERTGETGEAPPAADEATASADAFRSATGAQRRPLARRSDFEAAARLAAQTGPGIAMPQRCKTIGFPQPPSLLWGAGGHVKHDRRIAVLHAPLSTPAEPAAPPPSLPAAESGEFGGLQRTHLRIPDSTLTEAPVPQWAFGIFRRWHPWGVPEMYERGISNGIESFGH